MGKVQALRAHEPPPRSPERQKLAAAIERHAAAERQIAALRDARERAFDRFRELNAAAEKAREALEQAIADEGRHLAAELMGEADDAPLTVRDATLALDSATAALDRLRRTREALEEQEKEAAKELEFAALPLRERVRDVVRADPAVRKLAAELTAARDRYRDLLRAADWLGDMLPDDLQACRNVNAPADLPTLPLWQAAVKALETDPDAVLPS